MYLSAKFLFMLSAALSVTAVPSHFVRDHRDIAARVAIPEPAPIIAAVIEERNTDAVPNRRRRDLAQRCIPRSSSSSTTSPGGTPTIIPAVDLSYNTPNDTSPSPPPVESTPTPTLTPADTPSSSSTSSTSSLTPTPSPTDTSITDGLTNLVLGALSGEGTFYAVGLGACGVNNTDSQNIVAVSHSLFDTYPDYDGVNPNNNPICGKQVTVHYQGASVDVVIEDRCEACAYGDLDFSTTAFQVLSPLSAGRIYNITWSL